MKRFLLTVLIVLLVLGGVVLFFAYSGVIDPAATRAHYPGVQWFLETARHSGISDRTEDLTVPDLSSQALFETGLAHYHGMCITCHGAPGIERSEVGRGLNPSPPDLATAGFGEDEAAESFWTIKHGIRMSGMPAFGITHSDEEIWGLVAVQKRLAELTPEEYAHLVENVEHHHGEDGHHGGGEEGSHAEAGPETGGESEVSGTPEDSGGHEDHDHGSEGHGDHHH